MQAMIRQKYGAPDVLKMAELETPKPKDDEVLIRVRAASLNAYDWHLLRADPFLVRLGGGGLFKPRGKILGADVAGVVESVGGHVREFKPGDEVYGDLSDSGKGEGGFAQFVCAKAKRLALKPASITFEEAAAVPMAAVTALQGLRDVGCIQRGQSVLINGASGGVGTFAVQIAKSFGAEVTGVCSAGAMDLVRTLGADQVMDYAQEDFAQKGNRYDIILDIAANQSISAYRRALRPNGVAAVVGFSSLRQTASVLLSNKKEGKSVRLVVSTPNSKDLRWINNLLETKTINPKIDSRYPLSELPEALRHLEEDHPKGKVILQMPPA
jgi:NADPH:quinone reductase-like Zn-dependent oxidoreductase